LALGTILNFLLFVKECIDRIRVSSIAGAFFLALGINGLYLDAFWDSIFGNLLMLSKDLGVLVILQLFLTGLFSL